MRFLSVLLVAGLLACCVSADAHPVHEVVQNAYLTLSPNRIGLQLELTAGPEVANRVLHALDRDHDRRISPAEAQAYAAQVVAQSRLTIDGRQQSLRMLSVAVPPYAAVQRAHALIRISAEAVRQDRTGDHMLAYQNGYAPAESRCDVNIFLKGSAGVQYRIVRQDRSRNGRNLVVRYATKAV